MAKGFLNLPWFLWAAFALIIAVIYFFIWPKDRVVEITGFRYLVLRWAHMLTWLLLAVNFLLRGLSPSYNGAANIVALTGGLIYAVFIVMIFIVK